MNSLMPNLENQTPALINERLLQFIKSRFARQCDFAEAMGWERQYLSKLVRGTGLGLTPVMSVLRKFPELDARWLLLGEGQMLQSWRLDCRSKIAAARQILDKAEALLAPCPAP